jgi:hypothetical protein
MSERFSRTGGNRIQGGQRGAQQPSQRSQVGESTITAISQEIPPPPKVPPAQPAPAPGSTE